MNIQSKSETNNIMETVLIKGDLSKLTPDERVRYYNETCHSLGLNPLTRPFEYINLGGKLLLYARRDCADQLRKINGVSLEIVSRAVEGDILRVHVRARLPDGRADEDFGAVYYPETLKGEARANAELRAITKGKRRTTLSICGLGWLDETEVADIPVQAHRRPPAPASNAMVEHDQDIEHNPDTGELPPDEAPAMTVEDKARKDTPLEDTTLEYMAREAAMGGEAAFRAFYKTRSPEERKMLNAMGKELRELMP